MWAKKCWIPKVRRKMVIDSTSLGWLEKALVAALAFLVNLTTADSLRQRPPETLRSQRTKLLSKSLVYEVLIVDLN